jgi:hypothetical protein
MKRTLADTGLLALFMCVASLSLYGQGGSGSVHVVYFDSSNNHLAQVYISSNTWHYQDISTIINDYPGGPDLPPAFVHVRIRQVTTAPSSV